MSNIILAHGILAFAGGKASTDKLKPYLKAAGHTVQEADYGTYDPISAMLFNDNTAMTVRGMADKDIEHVGIGHSNGCAVLMRTAMLGTKFKKLILINPALKRDIENP